MDTAQRPILFVGLPESGLLNPLLVLAGELAARGTEDLWFATDEHRRAEVTALSARSEVRFASLGDPVPELSAVTWDDEVYAAVTQRSRFKATKALIEHSYDPSLQVGKYRRLEAVVEQVRPALMVVDVMCTFAINLAITKGIPFVPTVPFLPSNVLTGNIPFSKSYTPRDFPVPRSGLPYPMSAAQQLANRLFKLRTVLMFANPRMSKVLKQGGEIRKQLGIAPEAAKAMARIDHAELVLCFSVAELDYPFDLPEKVKLVGALVPDLPQAPGDRSITDWLDAQESVVYLGFGTITRLTRDQVTALVEVARRMSAHQFLWKLPREQQHLLPPAGTLPANLRIEGWLPSQLDVLAHPKVRVFFNHAGGNAYHEGLYFGKPLVSRPLWVDCYDQAVRAESLGAGLTVDQPHTVDPDDVVDKLTRVLTEPSFTERAAHMSALLQAAGGRRTAADLLMKLPALA
ncbi:glycosyltransferase [Amycolatopsis balhimycina DSM 5908]|uniref:Glycosyltransferase n=1 Tax=Amycolatopsis balhimycina DSM 5908 TaxID=1081091 RepID=A0A428W747_AMYBA|nr:glycosyltransferase [Amycolatopsis balhimycina]RSM38945.1 glycosyltransferase [Amycolatopsis balhimycina DSM 5908]